MEMTREEFIASLKKNKGDLSESSSETTNYSPEEKKASEEPENIIETDNRHNAGMFKDYDIRVWDNDVFINSKNLHYWGGDNRVGLQCDFCEGDSRYQEIQSLCDEIREKMLRLNGMVK